MSSHNTSGKEYEVLMSPMLSNRLDKIENRIEKLSNVYNDIENKFSIILEKLDENSKRWEENKILYLELLKENKSLSKKNMELLNENRDIYLKKFNQIHEDNNDLIKNISNSNNEARNNNMYWRTSGNNTVMKAPTSSSVGDILWPWGSAKKSDYLDEPDSPPQ